MIPHSLTDCIPEVTDADIEVAQRHLGVSFDAARLDVLRSNESFDVQACPGSGKTTLLVAKLAMLADKWPHTRRGICVLSHTNVARLEIEKRLARTAAGQRLLAYPHFVGTIHSFVNDFLALPLLRSEGRVIRLIDDDACGDFCRRLLYSNRAYTKAKQFLAHTEQYNPDRTVRALRYEGVELTLGSAAGKLPCGASSASFQILSEIKQRASDCGLWRFDDMFAWGDRLLAERPEVAEFARWRFPAVFLDEMQDTSELQGRLLATIFPASVCGLRQRFGDPNQAIFDYGGSRASTDPFPGANVRLLPSSQRFGPTIATKAEPLAPDPPHPALAGEGPRHNLFPVDVDSAGMPHTVFLFSPDSAECVLPAFGRLLLETFPDTVLHSEAFWARAVGRVGRSDADGDKTPRHLGDYWVDYEPHAAKLEARPEKLADYVHLAQRKRTDTMDCAESVKAVAKGICELIAAVAPATAPTGGQAARRLWAVLKDDEVAARILRNLVWRWCVDLATVGEQDWAGQVARVRRALQPVIGEHWTPEADAFCQWSAEFVGPSYGEERQVRTTPNRYRFVHQERFVNIDVGTIHGAKGQTHTATLVLETFSWEHDIADVMPWLVGQKRGAQGKDGIRRLERLRLIYTAMTRPTHLLCLAVRSEALGEDTGYGQSVVQLQERGWRIQSI